MTCKNHINKYKLKKDYHESDLQGKIGRWLKDAKMPTHACEVKITKGGTLNFSKFEDQQLPSLEKAAGEGKYHKLTDASTGCKPFDYFYFRKGRAYVACQFWKDIQQEIVYFMHIKDVLKIKRTGAKSLKEKDFIDLGFSVNLSKYK